MSHCYRCGEVEETLIEKLYGYTICQACKIKVGFYHDETIKKHQASFQCAKDMDQTKPTYQEEVDYKLLAMEKDYISKRIKLLHIQDRLRNL